MENWDNFLLKILEKVEKSYIKHTFSSLLLQVRTWLLC